MSSLTRTSLDTLLAHMVRSPEVFMQASTRILPECFDDGVELAHKLIWRATLEFHKDFNKLPPKDFIAAKISQYADGVPMLTDPNIYSAVQWTLHEIFKSPPDKDLVPEAALKDLDVLNFERNAKSKMVSLFSSGAATPENISAELRKHRSVSQAKVIEPFAIGLNDPFIIEPRIDIGVPFIVRLLGGGMRKHELYGFLAPSGGGKTTLSNQIAISYALKENHVFVFTYEQPPGNEYMIPVYACAGRVHRDKFNGISKLNDLPPEDVARLAPQLVKLKKYLHFVDMSGSRASGTGFGGPLEIAAELRRYSDQGIKPAAFVIDWFWPMFLRWTNTAPSMAGRKNVEMRILAQETMEMLHQITFEYGCWAWVNQQLACAEAQRKGKHEHQTAAEFKSFSWYTDGCFTLNMLDEENSCGTLFFSKARNTKRSSITIQLEGEYATFIDPGQDMKYDPHQKKIVKAVEYNKVPTERVRSKTDENYTAVG